MGVASLRIAYSGGDRWVLGWTGCPLARRRSNRMCRAVFLTLVEKNCHPPGWQLWLWLSQFCRSSMKGLDVRCHEKAPVQSPSSWLHFMVLHGRTGWCHEWLFSRLVGVIAFGTGVPM